MGIQETLKALSDPVRRDILEHLKHGRMPAGDIADLFDQKDARLITLDRKSVV